MDNDDRRVGYVRTGRQGALVKTLAVTLFGPLEFLLPRFWLRVPPPVRVVQGTRLAVIFIALLDFALGIRQLDNCLLVSVKDRLLGELLFWTCILRTLLHWVVTLGTIAALNFCQHRCQPTLQPHDCQCFP